MILTPLVLFSLLVQGKFQFPSETDSRNVLTAIKVTLDEFTPGKINSRNVSFQLFTRGNPTRAVTLDARNLEKINPQRKFKFFIHGWGESSQKNWLKNITGAYLIRGDYNLILVDWSRLAFKPYAAAAENAKIAGSSVANLIKELDRNYNIPLKNVHIVGHSLGAHVAGFAGKEIIKLAQNKIARITGLDPAGPFFEGILIKPSQRLDKSDAEFVDVVHTNGGKYGFITPIGHVDFYPNGGIKQPGCDIFQELTVEMIKSAIFCDHIRSYQYFTESINAGNILALKCDSWRHFLLGECPENGTVQFGEALGNSSRGVFYFKTNSRPPYLIH